MPRILKISGLADDEYDLIQYLKAEERRMVAAIVAEAIDLYFETYYGSETVENQDAVSAN